MTAVAEAPAKILVVDDDPFIRDMLVTYLGLDGYLATGANGGAQAIELVDESTPDLVILDVMMPEMDGLEVLRELRLRKDKDTLPVVMLSALSDAQTVGRGFEEGCNAFLNKPISPDVLGQELQRWLN